MHIVLSLNYFFQNTNFWIIVVFIHKKRRLHIRISSHQYCQHFFEASTTFFFNSFSKWILFFCRFLFVHKFKLLFLEYKCLDHSGIFTRKKGGSTYYSQVFQKSFFFIQKVMEGKKGVSANASYKLKFKF